MMFTLGARFKCPLLVCLSISALALAYLVADVTVWSKRSTLLFVTHIHELTVYTVMALCLTICSVNLCSQFTFRFLVCQPLSCLLFSYLSLMLVT